MCSSKFRPGPPSEQAQAVSEAINRVLKESKVLDLKDLCIEEGKAVWVLYVDAVCVAYDGNIFDAALAAIMAALNNGTRSKIEDVIILIVLLLSCRARFLYCILVSPTAYAYILLLLLI